MSIDPNRDWTQDDSIPFGHEEEADSFTIGEVTAARSADQIERDNAFVDMPPGDHLLIVAGFPKAPTKKFVKCDLGGKPDSYDCYVVEVRLAMPSNPKCSIVDFFQLPPDVPRQQKAYFDGIPEGKKQAGWAASKFIHFINRLGFKWEPGQPLPEQARQLKNWKGRAVWVTVDAGKGTYTDKDGQTKPSRNQIRPFSYRVADAAAMAKLRAELKAAQAGGGAANGGAAPAASSPAAQPVVSRASVAATATADDGLDDI